MKDGKVSYGSRRGPGRVVTLALLAVLCAVWGTTWLVVKWGLRDLPPFGAAGVRFAMVAAAMAVVAPWLRRREGGGAVPGWLALVLGATNFAGSYAIVYFGETVLPSGLVSTLWAIFPLLMAVGGHFFLEGERLRLRTALGFLLGFGGVALLFWKDLGQFGPSAVPVALLVLAAPTVSAVGNIAVKRWGSGASAVVLARDSMLVAAILLGALALVFERDRPVRVTPAALAGLAYLSLVGTCLTFGVYLWLLRHMAASRLSLIAFVTPAVALLLGWAVDAEPLHWHTLLGAALILGGVALGAARTGAGSSRAVTERSPAGDG